jgi:hypothetical protein
MLRMWDDIRTWIKSQKLFIFPDIAMAVPNNDDYLMWRNESDWL